MLNNSISHIIFTGEVFQPSDNFCAYPLELLCTGGPRAECSIPGGVLVEKSGRIILLALMAARQLRMLSVLQAHIAGSWPIFPPPACPSSFLQSCSPSPSLY